MAIHYSGYYRSVRDIGDQPTGWYNIDLLGDGNRQFFYVDQDYDGGGWICVLANRGNTGGMKNLTYNNGINNVNYRSGTSNATNAVADPRVGSRSLADYNVWVGLKYWFPLAGRVTADKVTIVQFVATSNGTALSGTHTKRYRWRFDSWNSEYAFVGSAAVSDETNTGQPGMYFYHATNTTFGLTTYDVDNDINGGNCGTYYNNNPWWYGSCWSGNYFSGGGYQDKPYWASSTTDNHQYGAVYIK
jgi:hypothetical protein